MAIDINAFGVKKSDRALANILKEISESPFEHPVYVKRLIHRVGRIVTKTNRYVKDLKSALASHDYAFYTHVLQIISRQKLIEYDRYNKNKLPEKLYSHLRCSIVSLYRDAKTYQAYIEQRVNNDFETRYKFSQKVMQKNGTD